MAWESQDDGFIAKILLQEGAKDIPVGTPAMIFVEEEVWVSPHNAGCLEFCCLCTCGCGVCAWLSVMLDRFAFQVWKVSGSSYDGAFGRGGKGEGGGIGILGKDGLALPCSAAKHAQHASGALVMQQGQATAYHPHDCLCNSCEYGVQLTVVPQCVLTG